MILDPNLPIGVFYGCPGLTRTRVLSTPAMLADKASFCPEPERGVLQCLSRTDDLELSLAEAVDQYRTFDLDTMDDSTGIHFIIATTGCLFAPHKCGAALAAVACRTHADPHVASVAQLFRENAEAREDLLRVLFPHRLVVWDDAFVSAPAAKQVWERYVLARWKVISDAMCGSGYWALPPDAILVTREEAIEAQAGEKRRVLARSFIELDALGMPYAQRMVKRKTIMPKLDEVLAPKLAKTPLGLLPGLKPRAIIVAPPVVHAITTQALRQVSLSMKAWNETALGTPYLTINGYKVELLFGSGRSPDEMNRLFDHLAQRALTPTPKLVTVAACGDDSLVVHGDWEPAANALESDIKQCDQAHTSGSLSYIGAGLRQHHDDPAPLESDQLGYVAEFFHEQCQGAYQVEQFRKDSALVKREPLYLVGKMPLQLSTGCTATTVANTSAVSAAIIHALVLEECRDRESFDRAVLRSGFTVKSKTCHIYDATFLKSMIVPLDNATTHIAVPLASWIVKLGKMLTNPHELYSHVAPEKRLYFCAYALGSGLKIPLWFPILGVFVRKLLELGIKHEITPAIANKINQGFYRMQMYSFEATPSAREHVLERMCIRYSLTTDQILEAEQLLEQVSQLPAMVSHPVFVVLACLDYGDAEYLEYCEGFCKIARTSVSSL